MSAEKRKRKRSSFEDDLSSNIMDEYWKVRKQYERKIAVQGLAFESSRKISPQMANFNFVPLQIPEYNQVKDNQSTILRRAETGSVVNKCPVIPLEHVESTPPMQYWTHTEANVIAEDEYTLSHIPFLGDSVDDTSFCLDLMKTFPEGIHGTKDGCGEYINDFILYYTVKAVKARLKDTDLKFIFKYVYQCFPNKASKHELLTMYPDLQQRFEPETITRQEFTNEEGELVANFSSNRLLNSYEVLLCHKCFAYDCIMHNATIADGYGGGNRTRKRNAFSERNKSKKNTEVPRPCSLQCYMTVERVKSPLSNQKDNTSKRNNLYIDVKGNENSKNGWTPHEESIFAILRKTGEDDFCKITKMLNVCTNLSNKKTCIEIYDYAARAGPLSPRLELATSPIKNSKYRKNRDSHRTFRAMKWANTNGKVENGGMFKPCQHKGDCREEHGCYCIRVNNLCTKYCGCSDECENRFPGCRCAPGNCRTKQCQCYYASWECDPDVCTSCNCDKLSSSGEPICKNVSIQRGLQKRLIVAPSQVAGWGCFANEDIEKNDFVSEYCGEVISQAESERRGKIYDRIKCSYLFGLNDEQVVDATRVGNVIRFANHSKNPNCRARVVVVNGDHKIGIFAQQSIKCGEELFFDYAYNKIQQVEFVPKELKSIAKHRERQAGRSVGRHSAIRDDSI
uniref:[histone H3]-lysine(27) N-trimethyltransferase n=1 Tax=Meloidogyne enterolobii TaxID=390850 RepID=A0A6V7VSD2_MELEN|nr:unnamed protein product [Meloidogyne enterolobii]